MKIQFWSFYYFDFFAYLLWTIYLVSEMGFLVRTGALFLKTETSFFGFKDRYWFLLFLISISVSNNDIISILVLILIIVPITLISMLVLNTSYYFLIIFNLVLSIPVMIVFNFGFDFSVFTFLIFDSNYTYRHWFVPIFILVLNTSRYIFSGFRYRFWIPMSIFSDWISISRYRCWYFLIPV